MYSRNLEIEERIKRINGINNVHNVNLYGGMGLDGISMKEKLLRYEEIEYMNKHPEIYKQRKM